MIHHERLMPPPHDCPADAWNVIEKGFHPEFLAQFETMLALGNGYLGVRGCPEEGGPNAENGTFINGFYETRPIVYGEEAYGFAKTGQTIVNVTDSKIIKLFVDDEPFWLPNARFLNYDRRLNMQSGTLDREILWATPAGKQVLITSRRLVSFVHRHVAAISYQVTLLNAKAPVVIASEMVANAPSAHTNGDDPRRASVCAGRVLQPLASYAKERRLVLCHTTAKSQMILACATDHALETACPHAYKAVHNEDFGQVAFTIEAQPGCPIHLTKYMVYHTSQTASPEALCGRAEWTMDRMMQQGFQKLLAAQEQYMDDFWHRSDVRIRDIREDRVKRTTVEIQQAIRFKMLEQARGHARQLGHKGAMFPWRTINGEEVSAYYAAGTAAYHINADIMYALRKYVHATGDEQFLQDYGAEMLVETARLWLDLGFYSDRKGGQFCINGVTGPDEYKTVVNNNAYTNLMARENLRYAAETVASLRTTQPDVYKALAYKTGLAPSEVEAWQRAAESMYVPYDEQRGIYPQDDSFLDREPWDFRSTPSDRYPLLLFYHPLDIYRKQVIKQADVLLAMFLLDEAFSLEAKQRNFAFYDPF